MRHQDFPDQIRLLIFDIDGVLCSGDTPISGASDAIKNIIGAGKKVRLLTNDAVNSRRTRALDLQNLGFDIVPDEIYTASFLTARYLKLLGAPKTMLLSGGPGIEEFKDIPLVIEDPQYVVVGDFFDNYSRQLIELAHNAVVNGAKLIATQKNPCCLGNARSIDIGFWVAGLEYSTGVSAKIIGKPSPESYQAILEDIGVLPTQTVMVGDDWIVDLLGASKMGITTVLVGNNKQERKVKNEVNPDLRVTNLTELAQLIDDSPKQHKL
jgi:HAD superfamily hydrolase (TIGR01458 family)